MTTVRTIMTTELISELSLAAYRIRLKIQVGLVKTMKSQVIFNRRKRRICSRTKRNHNLIETCINVDLYRTVY